MAPFFRQFIRRERQFVCRAINASRLQDLPVICDFPDDLTTVSVLQLNVPQWIAVLAGQKEIINASLLRQSQRHTAADTAAFGLIALRRQPAMLSRPRTNGFAVMTAIDAMVRSAVIMHIANGNDQFVRPVMIQQWSDVERHGGRITGRDARQLAIAEDGAPPHRTDNRQNSLIPAILWQFQHFAIEACSNQKRTGRMRQ